MNISTHWLHAPDDLRPVFGVRENVFMQEQGFQNEFDDTDNTCWHLALTADGKTVGCARIFPDKDGLWHVGRVAVMKEYRKCHLGSAIMDAVEKKVAGLGGKGMILGPTIGSIIIRPLSQLTTALIGGQIPGLHLAIYGILLIVCIRFFPNGFYPLLLKLIQKVKGKFAKSSARS